jgi:hypothetical protein
LLYTLAHECQEQRFTSLDLALDLVASDVRICHSRMEGHFQIEVRVRVDISSLRMDGEPLSVLLRIPLVLCLNISEVREL